MTRTRLTLAAAAVAACVAFSSAAAGIDGKEVFNTKIIEEPAPAESPWSFRIEPYGWLTSLSGTNGVKGFNTELDVPFFNSVLNHIDIAAALELEIRRERWGILADGFYAELSAGGSPPGPFYKSVNLKMKQFIGELALAYRIVDRPAGFVDLYGGIRYNYLSLNLQGTVDTAGVRDTSEAASQRIVAEVSSRARALAQQRIADFRAAAAARRETIAATLQDAIRSQAEEIISSDVTGLIERIQSQEPGGPIREALRGTVAAVADERIELARAAAEAQIAQLRASVETARGAAAERAQQRVQQAQERVQQAEEDLADAIEKDIRKRLRTSVSGDTNWVDPIIGFRGQWNITDRFFLAADGNIGGFGLASEFVWEAQATLGYSFCKNVFTEIGYRYLHTEYSDGGFVYNMAQYGMFVGLGLQF